MDTRLTHIPRYLIEGVEKTVNLVKNSQQFLDDPDFEKNLLRMRDSIGSDLRKVGNTRHHVTIARSSHL